MGRTRSFFLKSLVQLEMVYQITTLEGERKMTNKTSLPDNCPICDKKMEKGYLRCKTWGVWGWIKERKPWTMAWCITEAYRCQNCKVIMLSSDIIES